VVGIPVSAAAWAQATLPISKDGCGVASASDVAPVARLAGVLHVLARVEPLLGCDRQMVFPLATEAGLLDALNARLPPTLEPLASWTRTGKVELPDGDVRRQHRWSSRVTQVKAAALLEAAAGRDVPRLETHRRRDLVVDLTIVHPNPVAGGPVRGSAVTFLKDKREQKCPESVDSCGRMGVDFSPMVLDTWGGASMELERRR